MKVTPHAGSGEDPVARVRTFLIADVRGYTRFTREHGDAEAARLAKRFAELARDAVEARGGVVIELRGDEALAVFDTPAQAVRAAVEFQATCAEEVASDPSLPLLVGIGIDVGEAVPVEDGYRGAALNMAARLCSSAAAGEVIVTSAIADAHPGVDGVRFTPRGTAELKGFDHPVELLEAAAAGPAEPRLVPPLVWEPDQAGFPIELDALTPLVDREHEMRWARGTWRQVRRGNGRVLVVSGPSQIGKTRLAAECAAHVLALGGAVRYAGAGGTATADALAAIRSITEGSQPTLLVLDDLDVAGDGPTAALAEALEEIARTPAMVLAIVQDPNRDPALAALVARADAAGDGHRTLRPLDADGVRDIARIYAGTDVASVPLESIGRSSSGVPGRVHEVMSEWARTEATRRLAAAAEWISAGRTQRSSDLEFANNVIGLKLGSLYSVDEPAAGTDAPCPYKGLASFEAADASSFFGRERLVGELAARTVEVGMLGVVGASGSGKSSVVAAGLLPSLKAGLLPGSERWRSVTMRPGEHPLAELGSALRGLGAAATLASILATTDPTERLVVFVDQFEEVFTACADDDERAGFIAELTDAAASPGRCVVIVALRGDFYGECAAFDDLAGALTANTVLVGPMSADELRRAIELPARRAGLRVESALTDALTAEVEDEPGGLPLLSTALVELWQERSDGWLRMSAYEATGGVQGAVARLAEGTYDELDDAQRERARGIFLRLTGPGDGDAVTRRRAPLAEFDLDSDPVAAAVMQRLTRDRLVTVSGSTVEVAHEALLREWPRLRGWIEEDAQGQQLHQHLIQAANHWEASRREDSELYRGARLSATLDWTTGHDRELNALERDFVSASREAGEKETKQIRTTNRRLRGLLVGVAIFLAVALVAATFAFIQRSQAQRSATVALSQSVGAKAVVQRQLDASLLMGVEAVRLDDSPQTRSDLLTVLLRSPSAVGSFRIGAVGIQPEAMALSPDGRTLAVTDNRGLQPSGNPVGELRFFDTATHRPLGKTVFRIGADFNAETMGFTPDGKELVVEGGPAAAEVIDVGTHDVVRTLPGDSMQGLVVSADGRFAYAQLGDSIERWDLTTGLRIPDVAVAPSFPSLPAVSTGTGEVVTLDSAGGGRIEVRDPTSLAVERSFPVPLPAVGVTLYAVAVSPDGTTAAISSNVTEDDLLRFVDLKTGKITPGIGGSGGTSLLFSPDGKNLVSDSTNDVLVWDVASASVERTLAGHSGAITSLNFDAPGSTLYASSLDGTVIVYDLSGLRSFGRPRSAGPGNPGPYPCCLPGYASFAASPNQPSIATTQAHGVVDVTDIPSGKTTVSFHANPKGGAVTSVDYSPDGRELVVGGDPGVVAQWRLGAGPPSLVRTLAGLPAVRPIALQDGAYHFDPVPLVAFSADGRWIGGTEETIITKDGVVTGYRDWVVQWDARTGTLRHAPVSIGFQSSSTNIAYNADGSILVTAVDDHVLLIDAATMRVIRRIQDPLALTWVAVSPDGTKVATGDYGGFLRLWDVATGAQIGDGVAAAPGLLHSVAFDPTGQEIVTNGPSGRTGLWAVPSLQQVGADLTTGGFGWSNSRFAGRGSWIVLVASSGTAMAWPVTLSAWERQACSIAGRNLTRAEWNLFLPGRPYDETCPGV